MHEPLGRADISTGSTVLLGVAFVCFELTGEYRGDNLLESG
jgi:hypothetical protein